MPHDPGEQDSQVLGGAWGEVQLGGVAHKVDGAVVEGVPRGVPGGALVVHIGHAGVVGLVEALVEGHPALPTCDHHQAPSCSMHSSLACSLAESVDTCTVVTVAPFCPIVCAMQLASFSVSLQKSRGHTPWIRMFA